MDKHNFDIALLDAIPAEVIAELDKEIDEYLQIANKSKDIDESEKDYKYDCKIGHPLFMTHYKLEKIYNEEYNTYIELTCVKKTLIHSMTDTRIKYENLIIICFIY